MSRNLGKLFIVATITTMLVALILAGPGMAQNGLTAEEELGKSIFFDEHLSANKNQSCATCHDPAWGFTGPRPDINAAGAVYPGSFDDLFGDRKPPTAAYGGESPILHFDDIEGLWLGGMFWDGRATGEVLGDPLAEQAQGPFLNPVEQALPSKAAVIDEICVSSYAGLFHLVCDALVGDDACDAENTDAAYDCVGLVVSAYEQSDEVNPFCSRYDEFVAGTTTALTPLEQEGLLLFEGDKAMCAACHPSGEGAVFTDFSYDNLGVPKNPENPVYERDFRFVDTGLGGFLKSAGYSASVFKRDWGKVKVPTLRNVDKRVGGGVKAYAHNGYFKSLEEIVHFYNTRDALPDCGRNPNAVPGVNCWPKPEVDKNVNRAELGNLGLTPDEEAAIVAFLKALTDECIP
jgi:cytochrome c peroxidase